MIHTHTYTHTFSSLVAAGCRVGARVAEGSAEVLVHHGTDVALEVREEDAAGAQVLGSRWQLLVLLFDEGVAEPAAILRLLHFGIQGQFLRENTGRTDCCLNFLKRKLEHLYHAHLYNICGL